MQTFLPYANFFKSAKVLDYRRLGKQRVEGLQLINVLEGKQSAWRNHPAAKMWTGYTEALKLYTNVMIYEWVKRGYNNTMQYYEVGDFVLPPWIGDPEFHASHRSNLLRKDPVYYSQFGWTESPDLEYKWL